MKRLGQWDETHAIGRDSGNETRLRQWDETQAMGRDSGNGTRLISFRVKFAFVKQRVCVPAFVKQKKIVPAFVKRTSAYGLS